MLEPQPYRPLSDAERLEATRLVIRLRIILRRSTYEAHEEIKTWGPADNMDPVRREIYDVYMQKPNKDEMLHAIGLIEQVWL